MLARERAGLERLARRLGLAHVPALDAAGFEPDVRAVEHALHSAPPPPHPVVFYGSSSIRLWATLRDDFPDVPIANLGFGGSTLAACSWFYHRLVRPLEPRALVLYAGDNDLAQGSSPRQMLAEFELLLRQLAATFPDLPLGVLSIKPSPALASKLPLIADANRRLKERVLRRKNGHWLNVFDAMLANGRPRPELFTADGLHMNDAGYAVWRRVVAESRPEVF